MDLERMFKLKEHGTTVRREVVAGLATFMTMSYIIFVNPAILKEGGVPFLPAIAATALGAAITTIFMGLYTNYPLALASGMGLNAALTFGVVLGMKQSWQVAMGIIFVEGVLVTLFVLTGVREQVFGAIPLSIKRAIAVGIGLFLAVIGMSGARFFVAHPVTVVGVNTNLAKDPVALVAIIGLIFTAVLLARRTLGAILIGIIFSTAVAIIFDTVFGTKVLAQGALAGAAKVVSLPSFDTVFQLDIGGALQFALIGTIFAFMMTDFFDTMGTVTAIGGQAGFLRPDGSVPRLKKVLLADSLAAVVGGLLGVSSITTYIESAAGVSEGGRTGLTAVVTGVLFAVAIFLSPLIGLVPAAATAPALIIIGFLMMTQVKEIDFENLEESIPAFLTLIVMPLTYSISEGIGYGFISYTLIKLFRGKAGEVRPLMWIVSVAFVLHFLIQARVINL